MLLSVLLLGSSYAGAGDSTAAASPDSVEYNVLPDLVRSAIIPGWGQINQEKPAKAVIFYGLSLSFLYGSIHNFSRWKETSDQKYLGPARSNLAFFLQIYMINLLDVLDTYLRGTYEPWQGQLHADLPLKSPWGAVARSAMLPGWGQFYNESYVKSVAAFGIFSTFAYNVINYSVKYQDTGEAYFRDRRAVHSWYLGLSYTLILLDAYVDANLYKFEEAMELTCEFYPGRGETVPMLGVRFEF